MRLYKVFDSAGSVFHPLDEESWKIHFIVQVIPFKDITTYIFTNFLFALWSYIG
jgi:hypothetical protein